MTSLALAAARSPTHLTGALLAVAGAAWIVTAIRMSGMDDGPWTGLGTLGWFIGVWAVMAAAMMLPSAWPTVAVYSRMSEARSATRPAVFTAAYVSPWIAFGAFLFAIVTATERFAGDVLAWDSAGRATSAAVLLVAAAYELTPLKTACLTRCRSPIDLLLPAWRRGLPGALDLGVRHGAWCVGCCWALMVSLFALGVMSLVWGAVVAIVIAAEKLLERQRLAKYVTAGLLAVLGVLVLAAPQAVPALTIPVA